MPDTTTQAPLSFAEYRNRSLPSPSIMKHLRHSPARVLESVLKPRDTTKALTVGTGIDLLVDRGEDAFKARFCLSPQDPEDDPIFSISPYDKFTTKVAREWRDGELARGKIPVKLTDFNHNGLRGETDAGKRWKAMMEYRRMTVLNQEDWDRCFNAAQAVFDHPLASMLVEEAVKQLSLLWDEQGVMMQGRPDFVGDGWAADLKSTKDASPKAWASDAGKYAYTWQEEFYRRGLAAMGRPIKRFYWIVVENVWPHMTAVFETPPASRKRAATQVDDAVDLWKTCVDTGYWPARILEPKMIDIPKWAEDRNEVPTGFDW